VKLLIELSFFCEKEKIGSRKFIKGIENLAQNGWKASIIKEEIGTSALMWRYLSSPEELRPFWGLRTQNDVAVAETTVAITDIPWDIDLKPFGIVHDFPGRIPNFGWRSTISEDEGWIEFKFKKGQQFGNKNFEQALALLKFCLENLGKSQESLQRSLNEKIMIPMKGRPTKLTVSAMQRFEKELAKIDPGSPRTQDDILQILVRLAKNAKIEPLSSWLARRITRHGMAPTEFWASDRWRFVVVERGSEWRIVTVEPNTRQSLAHEAA
jgi:hypothetical protein